MGFERMARTNDRGSLVVYGAPGESLSLQVSADGFLGPSTSATVFPGRGRVIHDVRLTRYRRFAGHVVDSRGRRLAGIEVVCRTLPHAEADLYEWRVKTDASGRFELRVADHVPALRFSATARGAAGELLWERGRDEQALTIVVR